MKQFIKKPAVTLGSGVIICLAILSLPKILNTGKTRPKTRKQRRNYTSTDKNRPANNCEKSTEPLPPMSRPTASAENKWRKNGKNTKKKKPNDKQKKRRTSLGWKAERNGSKTSLTNLPTIQPTLLMIPVWLEKP